MAAKIFGLDEKIELAGRTITLREELSANRAHPMRGGSGPTLGKHPFAHVVVVHPTERNTTEQFDISEADYRALTGEPATHG